MKDINWYTVCLFIAGIGSLADTTVFHLHSVHWIPLLLVGSLAALLDLFPIRLPTGMPYYSGCVASMFLLTRYGLPSCELSLAFGVLASGLRWNRGKLRAINWYRAASTLGMYVISAYSAKVMLWMFSQAPTIVTMLFVFGSYELMNVFLFALIQRSIGNRSHSLKKHVQAELLPIVIFAVVLTRFLSITDNNQLIIEMAFTLFFLVVICVFSIQYQRMADAYRESEEKYRLIAENTLDVIVVLSDTWQVTYVSPSHDAIMGWSGKEFLGSSLFREVHPEDKEGLCERLVSLRNTLKPFQAQFRYRHAEREWIIVECTGSPVVRPDGRLDQVVMVVRDITDRMNTEELLRQSDKLAVVGQLAAGVAHELRNPLTALKGFLQLLHTKVEDGHEYIDIMMSEMNRIELIIGEFLILAKPQVAQFQVKSPEELLHSVIALLDTQAILNNVQIVTRYETNIPNILCGENQMKQVFINVLKNAIEAMPSGGEIIIELMYNPSSGVVIRFHDHGVGIPEDNLPRLGEPFYTTKESGTGLGLMVSYRIVQSHHGQMRIESQVNVGTTVEICLPGVS